MSIVVPGMASQGIRTARQPWLPGEQWYRQGQRQGGGPRGAAVAIGNIVSTWEDHIPRFPRRIHPFRGLLYSLNRASAGHLG